MKRQLAVSLLILCCYLAESSVTAQEDATTPSDVSNAIYAPIQMCDGPAQFEEGLVTLLGLFNLDSSIENAILRISDPFLPIIEQLYWKMCESMKPFIDRLRQQVAEIVDALRVSPRARRCLTTIGSRIGNLFTRAREIVAEEGIGGLIRALWHHLTSIPSDFLNSIKDACWHFIEHFLLPAVMQAVTKAVDSGALPESAVEALNAANSIYHLLHMMGYFST